MLHKDCADALCKMDPSCVVRITCTNGEVFTPEIKSIQLNESVMTFKAVKALTAVGLAHIVSMAGLAK
jgi:hypothetical protein